MVTTSKSCREVACWNPVLFTMPSGEILLFYKGGRNPREWSGFLKRSISQGKKWSEAELLPAGILGPVRSRPLLLKDGTLLCDSSIESWKRWGCWIDATVDGGRSWMKSTPINVPNQLFGVIQPSLFLGQSSEVKMVMRSHQIGSICTASSKDGGKTWSDPVDLGFGDQPSRPAILPDGRVVLAWVDRFGTQTIRARLAANTDAPFLEETEVVLYSHKRPQAERAADTGQQLTEMNAWTYGLPFAEVLPSGDVLVAFYAGTDVWMGANWCRLSVDRR